MSAFNAENIYRPILANIENGSLKTTHQLRMILDGLAEEFHVRPLSLLVTFREWLLMRNIELSTMDGMVEISTSTDRIL
jgi:hypothetical protein